VNLRCFSRVLPRRGGIVPEILLRNARVFAVASFVLLSHNARAQNLLTTLEREMRQLVEAARPSVVTIMAATAAGKSDGGGFLGLFRGKNNDPAEVKVGSGLIVSRDGFVVTKESVVRGANQIEAALADGQRFRAELVALDSSNGIAVLKMSGEKFTPAPIASAESVEAGSWVTVIGNALGMPQAVSMGVVSTVHSSGVIQISVNIDPGSNGSPIFNAQGMAVGIVSGRMGLGAAGMIPENYFSCTSLVYPLASYLPRLREIVQNYYESRGWLGVRVMADPDGRRHLRVLSLVKDGPAERSGLQVGDVITSFAGKPVDAATNLPALVAACRPGASETVKVLRGDRELSVELQIGKPAPLALNELRAVEETLLSDAENGAGKTPAQVEAKKFETFQLHQRIQNLERELKYLRSLQKR